MNTVNSATLRSHQTIFAALGLGVVAFAAIAVAMAPVGTISTATADTLFFAAAGATVLGILAAFLIQQRVPEALASTSHEEAALDLIFRRNILSMAALELPALLGVIGMLLTGDASFLTFLLPFFVVLGLLFPTAERVRQRLGGSAHRSDSK